MNDSQETLNANHKGAYAAINPEPHFIKKESQREFRFKKSFRTYWPLFLIPLAFWVGNHFKVVINQTDSLSQKVWFMVLNQKPKRGDYVAFKAPTNSGISSDIILHKQVLGIAGDTVTRKGRDFFINGEYVATAKTHSLVGSPLTVGPTGTIPEGHYYVSTPHKDSFDSRYETLGWINRDRMLGVLYPLW